MRAIHEVGLGALTAKIARRAGVAVGTLFTYFANKEELLNELCVELKDEVCTRVNANFPHKGAWNAARGIYGRACSIGPSNFQQNARFRCSFIPVGTMLAEMGEHQLMIRDYLRHAHLHVTNKYLQATTASKRLAQGKLDVFGGSV